MKRAGAIPSNLSNVNVFNTSIDNVSNITQYKLKECLSVKDQGDSSICASLSSLDAINYLRKMKGETNLKVSDDFFYENRKDKKIEGMSIRECLDLAKEYGYINLYAQVRNTDYIKSSIIHNGPCIICLPVFKYKDDFWNGSKMLGYHAVVLIGFNESGFILKNSWGTEFGDSGFIILPYNAIGKIKEAWTLMS